MFHFGSLCGPSCKGWYVVVLILGVLFFLGTLEIWPEFTFEKYWPLVLVVWGLHGLFCQCMKK